MRGPAGSDFESVKEMAGPRGKVVEQASDYSAHPTGNGRWVETATHDLLMPYLLLHDQHKKKGLARARVSQGGKKEMKDHPRRTGKTLVFALTPGAPLHPGRCGWW
jgi:hypothetical protein